MKKRLVAIGQLICWLTALWMIFMLGESTVSHIKLLAIAGFIGFVVYQVVKTYEKQPKTEFERKTYQPSFLLGLGDSH